MMDGWTDEWFWAALCKWWFCVWPLMYVEALFKLSASHPKKSWDITVNPSCAGMDREQRVVSSISQFTPGGLCSQSGWIPLLDVHADTYQLCTCRRFYNCVFRRCSENSPLSASPDKVKTTLFSSHIPSNTCLQLKASAKAYGKSTVTNLLVNPLE